MKHLKLFENWKAKYKLIKKLPEPFEENEDDYHFFVNTSDPDEIQAIISELEKLGYEEGPASKYSGQLKNPKSIFWEILDGEYEQRSEKYFKLSRSEFGGSTTWRGIKFEDYFEPLKQYNGYHTGKQYGI